MTKIREKMMCPDCGVEMNHHADKVDYSAALAEGAEVDPVFGGQVQEAHTCPVCGRTYLRRADAEEESESQS
jgi:rRNA maturation endonuclease Nob1